MQYKLLGLVLIAAVIIVFSCACTEEATEVQTPVPTTATPQPTTAAPTPTEVSLEPGPTEAPPSAKSVTVDVSRDPIDRTITVVFRGGKGQYAVQNIDVRFTLSTGEVIEEQLGSRVNDEVQVVGSTGTDRVEVTVLYNDGTSYKILDNTYEFKSR
ncbi:MAG: hypothetical protein QCH35_05705 [Methanomicrobiaceae archaeon]|nr:hypothetical protein [Methanomicrobiaceae archaeon]